MSRTTWARIVVALAVIGLVLGAALLIAHNPQAVQPGSSYSEF